jgi:hypothetical protein
VPILADRAPNATIVAVGQICGRTLRRDLTYHQLLDALFHAEHPTVPVPYGEPPELTGPKVAVARLLDAFLPGYIEATQRQGIPPGTLEEAKLFLLRLSQLTCLDTRTQGGRAVANALRPNVVPK